LIPLLIVSGIAVLVIIALVIISAVARQRAGNTAASNPRSNGNGHSR
jgi:uncharacterized MAPEG superfamily protein